MLLELKNIDKSFGEKKVLQGVSFRAEGGKAFGLLGRNGAGKTTSIRILMNVFPANGGQVLLDGKPIDYDQIGFGYLPEERGLYPKKQILDQLLYFAQLKGLSAKEAVTAVDYWLERLGMVFSRNDNGEIALRALGGQSHNRTAYAGASGKKNCFIVAMDMQPIQLRIADVFARSSDNGKVVSEPRIAFIESENIYIEPLTKTVLNDITL